MHPQRMRKGPELSAERMRKGPELSAAVDAVNAAIDRVSELRSIEARIGNGKRGRPRKFPAGLVYPRNLVGEFLDLLTPTKIVGEYEFSPKRRGRPSKQ